ncbi:MAG: hypothetical protein JWO38_2210 [Gemmataceae bacterium]|nr:hypothetical protein [Gemmataceae bacterium]
MTHSQNHMPGFTASESLDQTGDPYWLAAGPGTSDGDAVRAAGPSAVSLDPNCGPCVCRIRDLGIRRYFFCQRDCTFPITIPLPTPEFPGGVPQHIHYFKPC